jgi:hypothetical protein
MKQKRAVLYELMRDHRGVGANGATGGRLGNLPIPVEFDSQPQPRVLTGAKVIRVPLGYLLLGVALILVIALAAYLIGHSRGQSNQDVAIQGRIGNAEQQGGGVGAIAPPLMQSGGSASRAPDLADSSPSRTAGPIESNPRKIGENYFVLVQTSRTNAIRVAEFCRKNGLEAYVDRVNNADFRVFVLPGYAAEAAASPAVAELERRIEEVKEAWNESVGRNDLGQHIAVKYRG